MAAHVHLEVLAILLLLPAAPASAASWQACKSPMNTMVTINDVPPSGVGYAKTWLASSRATTWYRTQDGGKSWKGVKPPLANTHPDTWTLADGNAVVTWEQSVKGVTQTKIGLYTAASNKTTMHTLEAPKGLQIERTSVTRVAAIPGQSKAFALGYVYHTNRTGTSIKHYVWYWDGAAPTWKLTKDALSVNGMADFLAASPTAVWLTSFYQPGSVLFWNGNVLKKVRTGAAFGESVQLLKAVPAVGSSPAGVWAKLTYALKGQNAEKLLLCDAATCTVKKAAGTDKKYYGSFLTHAFFKPMESAAGTRDALGGFDAASTSFALVWEMLPSGNPNSATVKLQQYKGATNTWIPITTATRQYKSWALPGPMPFPAAGYSPQLLVSVASATRAVAVQAPIFAPPATKGSVVSLTWNGAKWTSVPAFSFVMQDAYFENDYNQAKSLQALATGNALLALNGGMWRLA